MRAATDPEMRVKKYLGKLFGPEVCANASCTRIAECCPALEELSGNLAPACLVKGRLRSSLRRLECARIGDNQFGAEDRFLRWQRPLHPSWHPLFRQELLDAILDSFPHLEVLRLNVRDESQVWKIRHSSLRILDVRPSRCGKASVHFTVPCGSCPKLREIYYGGPGHGHLQWTSNQFRLVDPTKPSRDSFLDMGLTSNKDLATAEAIALRAHGNGAEIEVPNACMLLKITHMRSFCSSRYFDRHQIRENLIHPEISFSFNGGVNECYSEAQGPKNYAVFFANHGFLGE